MRRAGRPRVLVAFPWVSLSPRPLIPGKQAGGGGKAISWRERGAFFQAVGGAVARCDVSFHRAALPRSAGAAMISRRACLVILTAVSHPCLASYPSPYRKDKTASKQTGRAGRSRRSDPGGQRRTSKQDENGERPRPIHIITRPTTTPRVPSHAPSTHRPVSRQAQTRRRTRRRTRRQTRRDEETTRARASKYGNEDKRTGKNKTPHFLTSRPTPFRQISLIRRPQLFPRPRSGDERASKQVRLSHVSSVARRVPITHALASSAIAHPGPYPPLLILIPRVIFPTAPS